MIDSKRRTCLALAAQVEHARKAGAKTLTPELVSKWILGAAEHAAPEAICESGALRMFHASCTKAELAGLLESYERLSLMDLQASAERELSGRMTA